MNISTLFDKVELISPSHGQITKQPTDDAINTFELTSGFKLPVNYKLFIKHYGIGELASFYRIFAPLDFKIEDRGMDLSAFNTSVRNRPQRLDSYGDRGFTDNFLLFSSSGGGDWYAWKKDKVLKDSEYVIYELARNSTDPTIVSQSFIEFVEKCCKRSLWNEPDVEENWTFVRC